MHTVGAALEVSSQVRQGVGVCPHVTMRGSVTAVTLVYISFTTKDEAQTSCGVWAGHGVLCGRGFVGAEALIGLRSAMGRGL